jgi:hypothetical protein
MAGERLDALYGRLNEVISDLHDERGSRDELLAEKRALIAELRSIREVQSAQTTPKLPYGPK